MEVTQEAMDPQTDVSPELKPSRTMNQRHALAVNKDLRAMRTRCTEPHATISLVRLDNELIRSKDTLHTE